MSKFETPLKNLKIASPCAADWNAMEGDERKRFCGACKLNVYNLSGMSSYDAENLLRNSEGRLCVRYFQRPDGTVLTKDCPVGWARIKRRMTVAAGAVCTVLLTIMNAVFLFSISTSSRKQVTKRFPIPFSTPTPMPVMGNIAMPIKQQPEMGVMVNTAEPTPKPTPRDRPMMGKVATIKG
jgi:hypothetical protein